MARNKRNGAAPRRHGSAMTLTPRQCDGGEYIIEMPMAALSTKEKIRSRSHLVGVSVLQKSSIYFSGLSRSRFDSTRSIQTYFAKFGKICKCVVDPRGMPPPYPPPPHAKAGGGNYEVANGESQQQQSPQSGLADLTAYITYSSEKGASCAMREMDASIVDGWRIRAVRATTRYCDDFLQGRHCNNLDCILLHELIKEHQVKEDSSEISGVSDENTSPESARGGHVLNSGEKENCWSSPRQLFTSPNASSCQGMTSHDCKGVLTEVGIFNGQVKQKTTEEERDSSDRNNRGGKNTVSLTTTEVEKKKPSQNIRPNIITPCSIEKIEKDLISASFPQADCSVLTVDLPDQQLFRNPLHRYNGRRTPGRSKAHGSVPIPDPLNGIDNPWDLRSPITINSVSTESPSNCCAVLQEETLPDAITCPDAYTTQRGRGASHLWQKSTMKNHANSSFFSETERPYEKFQSRATSAVLKPTTTSWSGSGFVSLSAPGFETTVGHDRHSYAPTCTSHSPSSMAFSSLLSGRFHEQMQGSFDRCIPSWQTVQQSGVGALNKLHCYTEKLSPFPYPYQSQHSFPHNAQYQYVPLDNRRTGRATPIYPMAFMPNHAAATRADFYSGFHPGHDRHSYAPTCTSHSPSSMAFSSLLSGRFHEQMQGSFDRCIPSWQTVQQSGVGALNKLHCYTEKLSPFPYPYQSQHSFPHNAQYQYVPLDNRRTGRATPIYPMAFMPNHAAATRADFYSGFHPNTHSCQQQTFNHFAMCHFENQWH